MTSSIVQYDYNPTDDTQIKAIKVNYVSCS